MPGRMPRSTDALIFFTVSLLQIIANNSAFSHFRGILLVISDLNIDTLAVWQIGKRIDSQPQAHNRNSHSRI